MKWDSLLFFYSRDGVLAYFLVGAGLLSSPLYDAILDSGSLASLYLLMGATSCLCFGLGLWAIGKLLCELVPDQDIRLFRTKEAYLAKAAGNPSAEVELGLHWDRIVLDRYEAEDIKSIVSRGSAAIRFVVTAIAIMFVSLLIVYLGALFGSTLLYADSRIQDHQERKQVLSLNIRSSEWRRAGEEMAYQDTVVVA